MGLFDDVFEAVTSVTATIGAGFSGPIAGVLDVTTGFTESVENVFTQGIFATDVDIEGRKRDERILANASRNQILFNEIMQDEAISEITRGELLKRFDTLGVLDDGAFSSITSTFGKAKEGIDPKFRARQATEEFLSITRDRPGQRQTRFVDSVSNLGV